MSHRVTIQICTRDRHSEVACLLVSLRNQTFKKWDLVLLDESSQPLNTHVPSMFLLNRLRQEDHRVEYIRNAVSRGVCHARNICIDNNPFKNPLILRVDDDVILDSDYIEKLHKLIIDGYDIASGVTPLMAHPEHIREVSALGRDPINKITFDSEGNIVGFADDCGISYSGDYLIREAEQFRSCALYKAEIHDYFRYPTHISPVGFREEAWMSLQARWKGAKIGVDLSAKAWHFVTPSGGCRYPNYAELVVQDESTFRKWAKRMFEKNGGAPK